MPGRAGSLEMRVYSSASPAGSRVAAAAAKWCVAILAVLLCAGLGAPGTAAALPTDSSLQQGWKIGGVEGEMLGGSVALSADGNTALVGSRLGSSTAAWIFKRSGSLWLEQAQLAGSGEVGEECVEGSECSFGRSVALSADGTTAVVGSPGANGGVGAVWVFTGSGSSWAQQGPKLEGGEAIGAARFGRSVAVSADGGTALIGGAGDHGHRGAAWVFARTGSSWAQQGAKLTGREASPGALFGRSVALSADGSSALIGGPGDAGYRGAAWAFTRSGSSWAPSGPTLGGGEEEQGEGRFGYSVALAADGQTAIVGARSDNEGAGAAWAFTRAGAAWLQQGSKLTGGEEAGAGEFGASVALSAGGNTALLGGPGDGASVGAAWVLARSGGAWSQPDAKLTAVGEIGNGRFGAGVALSENGLSALIGGYDDTVKDGAAWSFAAQSPPQPPLVAGVSPSSGTLAGGTPVTITGSGFLPGESVTIGGAATGVEFVSETELRAITPAGAAGTAEVVVHDANGTSSGGPLYTFLEPPAEPTSEPPLPLHTTGELIPPPAKSGVLGAVTVVIPPPVLGVSGNVAPVSGVVLIRLPGSGAFVPLAGIRQVPFGTVIDATHGSVTVTTVGPGGKLQTITYYAGAFVLTQGHNGRLIATLYGGTYAVCPTARERAHHASISSARSSAHHVVRKLWSSGHGSYSTKGNYATGAVLGTRWLTVDRCDGTLIRVATDRVAVTNLRTHRRVVVKAGHSYFAKAN
jgi:hypothetical protein